MADVWDKYLTAQPTVKPPTTTSPSNIWDKYLPAPTSSTPPQPSLAPALKDELNWNTWLREGKLDKVIDAANLSQYALGGLITQRPGEHPLAAMRRGISSREYFQGHIENNLIELGVPKWLATHGTGFIVSAALDPITYIPVGDIAEALRITPVLRGAIKLGGEGLRAVEEVVPFLRPLAESARGMKILGPLLERAQLREVVAGGEVRGVGEEFLKSARAVAGNNWERLSKAVGLAHDIGADAMMEHLSNLSPSIAKKTITRDAAMLEANNVGLKAMAGFVAHLPAAEQQFIKHWSARFAEDNGRLAQNLVRLGFLSPEAATKWGGLWLRRIYEKFRNPAKFVDFLNESGQSLDAIKAMSRVKGYAIPGKAVRGLPSNVIAERGLLSEEARKLLGEIPGAHTRYIVGRMLEERLIARGEMFHEISSTFGKTAKEIQDLAAKGVDVVSHFRQVAQSERWGHLAGQYVPKDIFSILNSTVREPSKAEELLGKALGWYKAGKTVLNPSLVLRKLRFDVLTAHNAIGIGALKPTTWERAAEEVMRHGDTYSALQKVSTTFHPFFIEPEVEALHGMQVSGKSLIDHVDSVFRWLSKPGSSAMKFGDQIAKVATALHMVEHGMTIESAAKFVESHFPNYMKRLPPEIEVLRHWGIVPFITFPYKVITEVVPSVLRKPGRAVTQLRAMAGNFAENRLTDTEKRSLPDWMQDGGWVKLPYKVNGHPIIWNIMHEFAYSDLIENAATPLLKLIKGNFDKSDVSLLLQYATPFGRAAIESLTMLHEGKAFGEVARREFSQLAPSLAGQLLPSTDQYAGGPLARSIEKAINAPGGGKTPSGGEPEPLTPAMANSLAGLQTQILDVQTNERSRAIEVRAAFKDARSKAISIETNQRLSPQQRVQKLREVLDDLQTKLKRYRETGRISE